VVRFIQDTLPVKKILTLSIERGGGGRPVFPTHLPTHTQVSIVTILVRLLFIVFTVHRLAILESSIVRILC